MHIHFQREPDDLFAFVPDALNCQYLEEVLSRSRRQTTRIRRCFAANLCAGMFGGTACSGATVLRRQLHLTEDQPLELVVKILSPDPVNLYKIDCRYDSRIAEVIWTQWWSHRGKPWLPRIHDARLDVPRREFWILREHFPRIGWTDVSETNWGHFSLDDSRLRLLIETLADFHAESALAIDELRALFPGPSIGQGSECPLDELQAALGQFADDEPLHRTIGIGAQERERVKSLCDVLADRPPWLNERLIVCVNADVKPSNLGFRQGADEQPVFFDFGAARIDGAEQDLLLLLKRLDADDARIDQVLDLYTDRLAASTSQQLPIPDFRRLLPWAEPLMLLRSLIEHADSLRWVPHQDRSKQFIHHFIRAADKQIQRCPR